MSNEDSGVDAGQDEAPPQKTRRVRVPTVGPGGFPGSGAQGYRLMDLPEDVAGQWDEDQWHNAPPGV